MSRTQIAELGRRLAELARWAACQEAERDERYGGQWAAVRDDFLRRRGVLREECE